MSTLAAVKYVFLDVVAFTTDRNVEAQADIVAALTQGVRESVEALSVDQSNIIFLPTGDGMCIGFVNIDEPYDIHIQFAQELLARLSAHNAKDISPSRKFSVRIGVNANTDNLFIDINGNRNAAGAGINIAARVMDFADGDQILVSSAVHEVLRYRERYEQAFRQFDGLAKHDFPMTVFQFVSPTPGLSTVVPRAFQQRIRVIPPLSGAMAFYFGLAHKYRDFIMQNSQPYANRAAILWLWYRAKDAAVVAAAKPFEVPHLETYGAGKLTDADQLHYYERSNFNIVWDFAEYLIATNLRVYHKYFETGSEGTDYRFVNAEGVTRLKADAPDVLISLGVPSA
jgi:class 3 adenylate cyclase